MTLFDSADFLAHRSGAGGGGAAIGSVVTSATQGSVFFAGPSGALAQDNANFFWDDTNKRLGIGAAAAPAVDLSVKPISDATAIIGRTRIDARTTDTMNISHTSMTTTSQTALSQTAAGLTVVGSAASQVLRLAQGGSTRFQVNASGHFEASSTTLCIRGGDNNSPAAPAFGFTTDTNTGMYNVGADQLGWSTNGTKRLGMDTYLYQPTPSAAPTDGNLHASSICWYLIEGSNTLQARVKYADGVTLKSLTTALALA